MSIGKYEVQIYQVHQETENIHASWGVSFRCPTAWSHTLEIDGLGQVVKVGFRSKMLASVWASYVGQRLQALDDILSIRAEDFK